MEVGEINPWLFQVEPYPGESLSHFLGCFRRANDLTTTGLGKAAGVGGAMPAAGGAIARWEKFRFNPLLLGNNWRLWLRLWGLILIG